MSDADHSSRRAGAAALFPAFLQPDGQARARRRRRPGRGVEARRPARRRAPTSPSSRPTFTPTSRRQPVDDRIAGRSRSVGPRRRLVRRRRGAARGEPRRVARPPPRASLFVNAVDDPPNASVYLGAHRASATASRWRSRPTGRAPALAGPAARRPRCAAARRSRTPGCASPTTSASAGRREGVPMEARRPRAARALNAIYVGRAHHEGSVEPAVEAARKGTPVARRTTRSASRRRLGAVRTGSGLVSLVGAGPGDPGAADAARAYARLAEADVVLYDALVSPDVLAARRHARSSLGRQAARPALGEPGDDQPLLVRGARRGKRVVRLKAGDPVRLRPRRRGGAGARRARASPSRSCPASRRRSPRRRSPAFRSRIAASPRACSSSPATPNRRTRRSSMRWRRTRHDAGRADGRQHARPHRRAPGRARLAASDAGRAPLRRVDAATRARGSARSASLRRAARRSTVCPRGPGTLVVGDVVSLAGALAPRASRRRRGVALRP